MVVKVGTSLLTSGGTEVDRGYIKRLSNVVNRLWIQGRQVAIVTSGAIGAGCGVMGFQRPPRTLPERQACAAAGQVELMKFYADAFRRQRHPRSIGQLLLTRNGVEDRQRYINARNTLEALLERGAVPIVNENDTVSVDEIKFGDNDTLSALVAVIAGAELLVILTDVPGMMSSPPTKSGRLPSQARVIETVPQISPDIEKLASPAGSFLGTGGMVSKLEAAKIVTGAGEHLVVVGGKNPDVLEDVVQGKPVGTHFPPSGDRLASRKRWLAFSPRARGTIHVDEGARQAVRERKKSLLPSGIIRVSGRFGCGDLVALAGPDGKPFARGLTNYTHEEVKTIRGLKTTQVARKLGQLHFEEVVHRDHLVVL